MKKSTEVITIDEQPRSIRKLTKKELREIYRREEKQWEDELELKSIQFHGYELLQLTFNNAIEIMNIAYMLDKPDLKLAFNNAFETYERQIAYAHLIQKRGIQTIPSNTWLNQKWYNLTKKDLFAGLEPKIQDLLRKQGVNYDN